MTDINKILQFGNFIHIDKSLNTSIKQDLIAFKDRWAKYNPRDNIPRDGLCVINERGETGPGPALDSLKQYNKLNNTNWGESDFNKPTELYHQSTALQELLSDILPWCIRTHFINLKPGGYFPPHRDHTWGEQSSFRLIIPISNANAPFCRFMLEDTTLHFELFKMYFINTTLQHSLFNLSPSRDSIWLIINALICEDSINYVTKNLNEQ